MMVSPLITIYMPTKGRPRLLKRALDSVLAQTFQDWELRIVVDGSDGETESLLAHEKDKRIFFEVLPVSSGACVARNRAISSAQGALITGLDDDDEFRSDHLAQLHEALKNRQNAFVCTSIVQVKKEGQLILNASPRKIGAAGLRRKNLVGNQVLTHTQYLQELGGFDPQMPAWQDFELWLRLASRYGEGERLDARSYIQHVEHEQERISNPERISKAQLKFVEKHCEQLAAADKLSLELLMYATSHQIFSLRKLLQFIRAGFYERALKAVLADRLPNVRQAYLKLRAQRGA